MANGIYCCETLDFKRPRYEPVTSEFHWFVLQQIRRPVAVTGKSTTRANYLSELVRYSCMMKYYRTVNKRKVSVECMPHAYNII